jgi:Zn-finger protein
MKARFVKQHFDFPFHKCYFCQNKAEGILSLKDGSEIRVCLLCATPRVKRLRKKVKRALNGVSKPLDNEKQLKNSDNSRSTSLEMPFIISIEAGKVEE